VKEQLYLTNNISFVISLYPPYNDELIFLIAEY